MSCSLLGAACKEQLSSPTSQNTPWVKAGISVSPSPSRRWSFSSSMEVTHYAKCDSPSGYKEEPDPCFSLLGAFCFTDDGRHFEHHLAHLRMWDREGFTTAPSRQHWDWCPLDQPVPARPRMDTSRVQCHILGNTGLPLPSYHFKISCSLVIMSLNIVNILFCYSMSDSWHYLKTFCVSDLDICCF